MPPPSDPQTTVQDLGLEDVKFKTEVRRNLVDWANHNWACKLVAGIADTEQPVFIQHCCAQDFSKAKSVGDNVWVGRLGKVARQLTAGDLSVVVNPVAIVVSCVNFLAGFKPNGTKEEEQPLLGVGEKKSKDSRSFGNFGW